MLAIAGNGAVASLPGAEKEPKNKRRSFDSSLRRLAQDDNRRMEFINRGSETAVGG